MKLKVGLVQQANTGDISANIAKLKANKIGRAHV